MKRTRIPELNTTLFCTVFSLIFAGMAMAQPPVPLRRPVRPSSYHPSVGPTLGQQSAGPATVISSSWTALGPAPLDSGGGAGGNGVVSGRVAGVAVDPANANNIYVAAAGGGVWQS